MAAGIRPPHAARVFQVRPSGLTANSKRVLSVAVSRRWIRSCCGTWPSPTSAARPFASARPRSSACRPGVCAAGGLRALDGDSEQVVAIAERCDAGACAGCNRRGVHDGGRDIAAVARGAGRNHGRGRSAVEAQPSSRVRIDGRRGRLIPRPLPSWIQRCRREVILDRVVVATLRRCRWQRGRRGRAAATVDRRPAVARPT